MTYLHAGYRQKGSPSGGSAREVTSLHAGYRLKEEAFGGSPRGVDTPTRATAKRGDLFVPGRPERGGNSYYTPVHPSHHRPYRVTKARG